jgi:uncharacterized membrane protein YgdD (TMEM256/DUF423 family)
MQKFGFILTALAIAIQAFGHHALVPYLDTNQLAMFETAARYLMWASIWVLVVSQSEFLNRSAWPVWVILTGVFLFCGSLFFYILIPFKPLMMLTPLGGVCMILGFLILGLSKRN